MPASKERGAYFELYDLERLEVVKGPQSTLYGRSAMTGAINVIQNKADPTEARALCERLQHEFEPFDIVAEGVLVWRYLGGPWEPVARVGFRLSQP